MTERDPAPPVLGWKEHAALPEWGIRRLRVKLDTGARSSALHVTDLEILGRVERDGDEREMLRFAVVLGRGPDARRRIVETESVGSLVVRDSGAREEERPLVRTRIVMGPLDRVIDLTVTDRSDMNFRMILGRTTLDGVCLVDPSRGYTASPPPRQATRVAVGD